MVFIPDKGDEAAAMAISALIHAMDETQMVPVVRKVYSARSSPRIGFLTPHIKVNYEVRIMTRALDNYLVTYAYKLYSILFGTLQGYFRPILMFLALSVVI